MNKKTWQYVIFCCSVFLLMVYLAANWIDKMNPSEPLRVSSEEKKVIYLTFDDGPSQYTEKILSILDQYEVKATFFVTGENLSYADFIFEEYKRGHGIGIHTYSHDYGEIYSSEEAYLKDMKRMNDLIYKQIGHRVNIFRFPGGASNTISRNYRNGIMSSLASLLSEKGYQYYDWNASNGDGDSYATSSTLITTAIKEVGEQQNVMMLMHDGAGNKATLEALPQILEILKQKGYEFKTIDNSTPVFHHHIAN